MILLAIETSTMTASVSVVRQDAGGGVSVLAAADDAANTHSDILLPLVQSLLERARVSPQDIDAVAVGCGPGSFTGLRIGMASAKGFAFAVGAPLWAVSSLAALAHDAMLEHGSRVHDAVIVPAIDARRQEIFAGFYVSPGPSPDGGHPGIISIADECVVAPAELAKVAPELPDGAAQFVLCGDGALTYAEELSNFAPVLSGARATPSAISVARLALSGPRQDTLLSGAPAYIRKSEAEIRFPNGNPGGVFSKRQ